jgi:hypothetical protein
MPAVLATPEAVSRWLDPSLTPEAAVNSLAQCMTLRWHAVDRLVGNVRKKEYACMAPLGQPAVSAEAAITTKGGCPFAKSPLQAWIASGSLSPANKCSRMDIGVERERL